MCIDLYVDKLLVYSNCIYSPSPVPSLVPSPMSPVSLSLVPSTMSNETVTGNTTYDTDPVFTPLPDHTLTIAIIMVCTIIPCLIWITCACMKCRKKKKVQPPKRETNSCCSKKQTPLPTSHQERGIQTN